MLPIGELAMSTYRKPLTIKTIEAIKPPTTKGQQDEYYDTNQTGLILRIGTSGKKVFYQRYRVGRKQGRIKIGTYPAEKSLKEAREEGSEYLKLASKGEDPALEIRRKRSENLLFKDLAEMYIEEYAKPNKRTWKEDERKLDTKFSVWNDRDAYAITRDDVLDRIEYIKQNHSPITANRNAALIKKLFKWAREKRLIPDNPATDIPKEKERSRDRILSDTEISDFWEACDSKGYPFGPCFQLMLLTGRREGSVARITWSDINFESKEWHIQSEIDKSGKPAVVPLTDLAIEILQDINDNYRIEGSDLVFTTTGKTPISGYSRAKIEIDKLSKVKKWVLHDLRRTCRTNLPRLGVSPFIAKLTIGHKIPGIDQIYDRYSYMPEKREALVKWDEFIQGLVEDKGSKVVAIKA